MKHTETVPSASLPQTQTDIALGALKLGLGVPARLGPPPLDLTEVTVAFLVVVNPDNHMVSVWSPLGRGHPPNSRKVWNKETLYLSTWIANIA